MSEQPASANVARFLGERALERPDGHAVLAPMGREKNGDIRYEELSFAALHAQSDQVAHGMAGRGIRRGERVLLMVKPGSDLIRACFALFKLGAVPVVIDPGMGLRHFLQCVRRTRPEALLGIPLAQWISRLFPSAFKSVRQRVGVGRRFRNWYGGYPSRGLAIADPGPDELAAILFTSGSTGPPKGVCYGHGQFDAQVRLIRDSFEIEPGEVDLPMLPIFALFNPALGMTTVVPEINPGKPARAEPAPLLQAIDQCGVTNSFGSPVLWKKLALHLSRTGQRFPRMRRILMAGAPVPPSLVRQLQPYFPNARIWSPYGATECLPVSAVEGQTLLEVAAAKTTKGAGTCVGYPVAHVDVRIIRIENRILEKLDETEVLPSGEIGEIIATGPTVTRAYDGLPEATARAKIADGGRVWHRMGDAGYLDAAGRLWFCGRIAERVVTPEGPLYTDCCEGIFNTLPGVNRSALIGLGKAPRMEPAVVIEPEKGDAGPDEAAVLAKAAAHRITAPVKTVFYCREFPVDVRHNAKINRLELARRYEKT